MGRADGVLAAACGQLGVTESPPGSNRTRFGDWYGLDGYPWCMMFVQWCFDQAGAPLPCRTASCSELLGWYRKYRKEQLAAAPLPGDVVIYNFGHTGIVESAAGDSITAIEGNTSPGSKGSQSNGGGVYRRTRSRKLVSAFIRPYEEEEDEIMTGKEIYEALQSYMRTQETPLWAREELEEAVRLGLTDGKNAAELIPRYQAAIIALRAAKGIPAAETEK